MKSAYDVVVVGGGPAGATAAETLARNGRKVMLVEREGRIKPCGGAIPTRLIKDFAIPPELLTAEIRSARIVAPSNVTVDMRIEAGFVGMVDREAFDPFLRDRAEASGAEIRRATCTGARRGDGAVELSVSPVGKESTTISARLVIGADGANSAVRRMLFTRESRPPYVFAYHEIIRSPPASDRFDPHRCEVHYHPALSPDFYGWVFPHGDTTSVGVGSAVKGFDLKAATRLLRLSSGLADQETLRSEGAPLPLKPLRRWDNGYDAVLAGDAAGVVAPASGEGIYYAMLGGQLAAEAALAFLDGGDARDLAAARRRFMREHGRMFAALGLMQAFWYKNNSRRERFAALCGDADIQRLVWTSYLEKRLVRAEPMAYLRVFLKDMGHVFRLMTQ